VVTRLIVMFAVTTPTGRRAGRGDLKLIALIAREGFIAFFLLE
jgi:hypothetical protein